MADLKAIIARLASALNDAAEQIDTTGTSARGQSGEGQRGRTPDDIVQRMEKELEIAKQLGDEKERIQKIEEQIARVKAEAAARSGENQSDIDAYKELRQSMQETKEFTEALQGSFSGLKDALGGPLKQITGFNDSVYKTGMNMQKSLFGAVKKGAKGFGGSMGKMGKGLKGLTSGFTGAGMAARAAWSAATMGLSILLEFVIRLSVALATITGGVFVDMLTFADKMGTGFARLTGTTDRWNNSLAAVGEEAYSLGLSSGKAAQVMADLTQQFSGFSNLSEDAATSLGTQVLLMEELGVASKTQLGVMDSLNRVMGMSGQQAGEFTKDLFDMAAAAKMAPEEMMSSFRDALPQLSVYGSQMKTEFMKLQAQGKATGMSVKELLDITGKYETFEGAAKAAQGLNAFLGGPYINTIELLTAKESDKMQILRDGFKASGKSFNDMNRQMQRGIAQQLGMSVEQARRQFAMSTEEMKKYNEQMKLAEDANTNLKNRVRETQPFMDTLKTAFLDVTMAAIGAAAGQDTAGGSMKSMQEIMQFVYKDVMPGFIKAVFMVAKVVGFMARLFAGFVEIAAKAVNVITFGQMGGDTANMAGEIGAGLDRGMAKMDEMQPVILERMEKIAKQKSKKNDFIFSKGEMHPIDSRDQFMGVKPTGYFDTSQKQMAKKIDDLTAAINRLAQSSQGGAVIEMDGREVARMVDKRIQEKYSFNLPSSGRTR